MIGIKFQGRLGNNLFQWAFGFTLAKKLRTSFFISGRTGATIFKYFYLRSFENIINYIANSYFYRVIGYNNVIVMPNEKEPCKNLSSVSNDCFYEGYFQSEEYFKECSADIKKHFKIKKKYKYSFDKEYGELFKNDKIIVINFRRGDYILYETTHPGLLLPWEYYEKALELAQNQNSNCKVICISDDITEIEMKYGQERNFIYQKFGGEEKDIIDFQILLNADIAIIANSTFSWWGAYLNAKPGKIIYAPKYWLGIKEKKELPLGIMFPEWNWIEVN